jgi:GNAT superfamily N-acetyltransferase
MTPDMKDPRQSYSMRPATLADRPALDQLIARSAREVGTTRYTAAQMEAALRGAFGVDTQLIRDGTYFVVEDKSGSMVACGGWSRRHTLFGSDQRADREPGELDPRTDAAKIRAFFVDPQHLRQGIATALLKHCEAAARAKGFAKLELMGTLTGVPFYTAHGYVHVKPVSHEMEPGLFIDFLAMSKSLSNEERSHEIN